MGFLVLDSVNIFDPIIDFFNSISGFLQQAVDFLLDVIQIPGQIIEFLGNLMILIPDPFSTILLSFLLILSLGFVYRLLR